MNYYAECPNMIPAERCEVAIYPSMLARSEVIDTGVTGTNAVIADLELVGVDEVKCPWSGIIEMDEGEDARGTYVEADCPTCGQSIRDYDAARSNHWEVQASRERAHALDTMVSVATKLTDPAHRFQVHVIVDDDWQPISVVCDLAYRGPDPDEAR
jgi:hypothetical protein